MQRVIPLDVLVLTLVVPLSLAPGRVALGATLEEVVDCARKSLPPSPHGGFVLV